MDGTGHVSAPAADRAHELMMMLTDPTIKAVVPPWGGVTAIDLLPLLDWETLRAAEPTWLVGYSDISTILTPMTLLTRVATIHGNNLMDTPLRAPAGTMTWLDIVELAPGSTFTQASAGRYRAKPWTDEYTTAPDMSVVALDAPGRWTRLDRADDCRVDGRLIGGCIETLCNVAGTPYADLAAFNGFDAAEGMIVYVEAGEDTSAEVICRALHGMRLAGFFERANAVLVGRTWAPDTDRLTQHEAVADALNDLGVPIIADVECGHVPPYIPLVNGARGEVVYTSDRAEITQTLC
jgi:muramoyltetrapeptide carboxypeptidase LdcA involved in peptidoglycan recycling